MERKVKRIFLLYWDKKTMAAVLIKSSVYACFSVVGMVKLHMHQVFLIIFLLYANVLLFFGSFLGMFFFLRLINREFLGIWKNKRYEKYVREREEEDAVAMETEHDT